MTGEVSWSQHDRGRRSGGYVAYGGKDGFTWFLELEMRSTRIVFTHSLPHPLLCPLIAKDWSQKSQENKGGGGSM